MPVLLWKHRTTKEAAKTALEAELSRLSHGDKFVWNGFDGSARVGFGAILNAKGSITDEAIIIEKCSGAAGGTVLRECTELLDRLFPGGRAAC